MLNYLSVTSGIAADTVAWAPLGWQCVAYAEFLMRCGCLTLEDACRAAADGPRYKSHGNSIAIPPLRWLGERIEKVLLPVLYPELFGVQEAV